MNVNGDLTPPTAANALRSEYNQNLLDNAQYVIANPCYTYDSETNNLMGKEQDFLNYTVRLDLDELMSRIKTNIDEDKDA